MKTCVVGHRGVGKTTLANRLRSYFSSINDFDFVDLDEAIEKRAGKKIFEIFIENGEKYFRELEQQSFAEALQNPHPNLWIVLGAGFDVTKIPDGVEVLWIRRQTDSEGRIFLDRPRLDENLKPLEEYLKRFADRDVKYRKKATRTYQMPEGDLLYKKQAFAVEKDLFSESTSQVKAYLTLLPDMFLDKKWPLVAKSLRGRFEGFELRDDLLNVEEMELAVKELPTEKFIYSYRRHEAQILNDFTADFYDWALELGEPSQDFLSKPFESRIISLHEDKSPLAFERYGKSAKHWKWSPEVPDWSSLHFAHQWQQLDPDHRSFLPRSLDGRWKWYRLLQSGKMKINFTRELEGSAKDQPTPFEFLILPNEFKTFAAVLGDPVAHSWTPIEHSDYFYKKAMPVFAIRLRESELVEAMAVLKELGLTHAAVTSPLKKAMALWAHSKLKAVNTLLIKSDDVLSTSTDGIGLEVLVEGIEALGPIESSVVVWGGGGTLESVNSILEGAVYYSSRTGVPRDAGEGLVAPKALIWAAPRSIETKFPPTDWKPSIIYDLNYKEDSMGREYAQISRAKYESGEVMFKAQAQAQRIFWDKCEAKDECK